MKYVYLKNTKAMVSSLTFHLYSYILKIQLHIVQTHMLSSWASRELSRRKNRDYDYY